MMRTSRLLMALALTAALGLVACGDDSNPPAPDKGTPDQMIYQDMGADSMWPDMGVDMMVQDTGADMPVGNDMPVSDTTVDAPPAADTATTDTGPSTDASTSCGAKSATKLTMPASGKLTVNGDTTGRTNDFGTSITCGSSYDFDGQQVYYQVSLTGSKKYLITVTPASWDAALYVFMDKTCNATLINTECGGAGGDYSDSGSSGDSEMVVITPTTTGDYIIAVDSFSTTAAGKFTLTIEEAVAPANDTCAAAKTLTFTSGKITETGNTLMAKNDVALTASDCTGNTTAGPDVFYKVNLTAGSTYKFELDGSGFNEVLYLFTGCSNVAGTCGTGMGADDWSSSSEELSFKPTTTGTYYIGVSGRAATDSGTFTLTIDEYAPVTNDTCATAKALTLTSGKGTVNGHNLGATDTVNLASTGCTGDVTPGGDVFYSVTLTAGKTYKFTAVPQTGFNHAIYLLSSCTNPTTTCVGGDDSSYSGSTETFTYSPTTTGTYYVVVDSSYTAGATYSEGGFTLTVQEVVVPTNDSCAKAIALTFSGTPATATATGDTSLATNAISLTSSGCAGWSTPGYDLFYKVTLTAGTTYTVTLTPDSSFDPILYVFTDCANAESTCGTGWGKETIGSGTAEVVTITPTTSGVHYIAVDSWSSSEYGTFTLEVK